MAAQTESNDGADLFWPGYVDAVTNLAINLLFVIAVMSIVVIGITLQISQMTKKKAVQEARQEHTEVAPSVQGQGRDAQFQQLQQALNESRHQLEQTQRKLQQAEARLLPTEGQITQTVQASQNKPVDPKSANRIQSMGQPAVVVAFSPDVVTMSASEIGELITKLKKISPLANGRWEISVISPKGLSESVRLAYYRANAARNALLENGVSSQAIDMRIHESTQAAADNSKVLVRWVP